MAVQTLKCNCCGGVYESETPSGSPYFHVCPTVVVNNVERKRDGHRNENRIYASDAVRLGIAVDGDPEVHVELGPDTYTRRTVLISEGRGVTVLHEGPRTDEEKNPALVEPKPEGRK